MTEQTGFDIDENDYLMHSRSSRRLHRKSVMYYLCDAWIEACSRSANLFFYIIILFLRSYYFMLLTNLYIW